MKIVLVNPEIPQNTGTIARSCAATKTPLHLVGKLGFEITEKNVRRAGLDYWPYVELAQHDSWEDFRLLHPEGNVWLFSKFAKKIYTAACFKAEDILVFGSETKGLGKDFISKFEEDCVLKIPILEPKVRSLNLSNAVNIALYEAIRQTT
ncbi:MAG: tRNA (cytidine(34)-2'-O)-methyltransferase [Bdellovibrionales bacterium]|nr:tRNA (cytidine(34)-2'-O)-methyltransferase [Bdellovibrionales bacterium]